MMIIALIIELKQMACTKTCANPGVQLLSELKIIRETSRAKMINSLASSTIVESISLNGLMKIK